eukprot:501988_1
MLNDDVETLKSRCSSKDREIQALKHTINKLEEANTAIANDDLEFAANEAAFRQQFNQSHNTQSRIMVQASESEHMMDENYVLKSRLKNVADENCQLRRSNSILAQSPAEQKKRMSLKMNGSYTQNFQEALKTVCDELRIDYMPG